MIVDAFCTCKIERRSLRKALKNCFSVMSFLKLTVKSKNKVPPLPNNQG